MVFFFNVSKVLCADDTLKKVRPLFCHFFGKSAENSAAEIFLGPLLRFAAEISAGWQH
jgi:hypothetical protein